MKNLIIIGAGGHGKVCADVAELMGYYKEITFLDDVNKGVFFGHKIVGKISDFIKFIDNTDYFVAIGNPKVRENIFEELEKYKTNIVSLIHPSAIIARSAEIGQGTIIAAGSVINPNSRIGKGCIVNTASSIDHDAIIEDFVHVASGAHLAGTVYVGKRTWLGVGSVVINNVSITSDCMIGAGAVVVSDINEACTYVGVPARKIK